jgi:DNA-binding transcriptional ArsR family regulator
VSDVSKTVSGTLEETRERHRRYLRAINSPVRRGILRALKDGHRSAEALAKATGLDVKTLGWHMELLVYGYCVEKRQTDEGEVYALTREGQVVDFMDK